MPFGCRSDIRLLIPAPCNVLARAPRRCCCSCAPVTSADNRLVNFKRIHQSNDVNSDHCLLCIAWRVAGEEVRGAVAAQIRNNDAKTLRCQKRSNVDISVNVVRPTMKQDDCRPNLRSSVCLADVQHSGMNLFQRTE